MTDPKKHVSKRACLKSKRSRFILAIIILIVIIAVVPSVVVTTIKKNNMGPRAKVFVPLYVYPAPEAWAPLENVYVPISFIRSPLSVPITFYPDSPGAPFGRQTIPSHIKI
jgi:hypothetical protein